MSRILITGGAVVTMEPGLADLPRGDLLVEDGIIRALAPRLDGAAAGAEVIDAAGCIVLPGFVNAHIHTWQTALRGIAGDWTILEYLRAMHAGIAPSFTPDDIHVSTLVGALNQLDGGTTTIVDWCHNNPTPEHSDAAVEALLEAGIRAVFLHGSPKPDPKPGQKHFSEVPHPRGELERLAGGRLAGRAGQVTLGMAILGPAYSTYEVSRADVALARELGLLCSMHCGGGPMLTPDGFTRLLAEGLVGPGLNIVHGNNLADAELAPLLERGASLTSTPECELQMGFGDPLIGRLRALGAPPSLGSDVESAMGGDMFTNMRIALQYQRARDNEAVLRRTGRAPERISIPCREALEWATLGGARMAGLDRRIGSLAPGKAADILLLRADALNLLPAADPVQAAVFHAGLANVDTVLVAGRPVKRAGRLLHDGLPRRYEKLAAARRRILAAAGRLH